LSELYVSSEKQSASSASDAHEKDGLTATDDVGNAPQQQQQQQPAAAATRHTYVPQSQVDQ